MKPKEMLKNIVNVSTQLIIILKSVYVFSAFLINYFFGFE